MKDFPHPTCTVNHWWEQVPLQLYLHPWPCTKGYTKFIYFLFVWRIHVNSKIASTISNCLNDFLHYVCMSANEDAYEIEQKVTNLIRNMTRLAWMYGCSWRSWDVWVWLKCHCLVSMVLMLVTTQQPLVTQLIMVKLNAHLPGWYHLASDCGEVAGHATSRTTHSFTYDESEYN